MPRANKSGWRWILVAGACAVALSIFTPYAGAVPVMALQITRAKPGQEGEINNLVRQLGTEATRWEAIEKLAKRGAPAVQPLIGALSNANEKVRSGASIALSRIGEPAVRPLIGALYNTNENVRENAAWALGRIGNKEAVLPFIEVLKKDPDIKVRIEAVQSLGRMAEFGLMSLEQIRETRAGIRSLDRKKDSMLDDESLKYKDWQIYVNLINIARTGLNGAEIAMIPNKKQ
jgi:hypothetical protein